MKSKPQRKNSPSSRPTKRNRIVVVVVGIVLVAFALSLFLTPGERPPTSSSPSTVSSVEFMKHGELTFLDQNQQPVVAIDVEIADDDASREQGLMYRASMEERQGMLFVFFEDGMKSFWMKNTVLSLDILFVNAENEIITIHKNTTPFSEQEYRSSGPARYVVEVVGGFTDRHAIRVGMKVQWRRVPAS